MYRIYIYRIYLDRWNYKDVLDILRLVVHAHHALYRIFFPKGDKQPGLSTLKEEFK